MNAQDILHFIISHSEMLIGITIGLALLTVIFILVLPAGESKVHAVDLSGIEETLKRVIEKIPQTRNAPGPRELKVSSIQDEEDSGGVALGASQVASSGAASPAVLTGDIDTDVIDKLKAEMSEREKKIKALESELSQAKQVVAKVPVGDSNADDDALAKIQELQSKLSEYAIIEEELADISKFKEENAKMKLELESLKANSGSTPAPVAAPVVAAPAAQVSPADSASPIAQAAALEGVRASSIEPAKVEVPKAEEPVASRNSETEDQVVREFKEVVDRQVAPKISVASEVSTGANPVSPDLKPESSAESPLDGSLDTSKMLQEIEKLGDDGDGDANDPMAGLLDTEKLLAEVRELGGPKGSSDSGQTAVDDLMSEFEAEQKQIKAKA